MKSVHYDEKGLHLDAVEKIYMWKEAMKDNQLNDEHTSMFSKIFGTALKGGQLIEISLYKTRSLGDVAIVNCKLLITELAPVPQKTPIKKLRYPVQGK